MLQREWLTQRLRLENWERKEQPVLNLTRIMKITVSVCREKVFLNFQFLTRFQTDSSLLTGKNNCPKSGWSVGSCWFIKVLQWASASWAWGLNASDVSYLVPWNVILSLRFIFILVSFSQFSTEIREISKICWTISIW